MGSNYKKLGGFIRTVDERNGDLAITNLQGVSITKEFVPSIANIIGTDLSKYKIVRTGQFAYGPVTSRNGEKVSIALLKGDDCIISSSYVPFEVYKPHELLPEYLMLWFMRPEFDRYARFMSNGSAREVFDWGCMCSVELPVPPISEQRKIVHDYQVIIDRIELLRKIINNIDKNNEARLAKLFSDAEQSDSKETIRIGDHVNITRGVSYVPEETTDTPTDGYLPIFRANNIVDGNLVYEGLTYVLKKNIGSDQLVTNRSMIIAMSSGSQAHVGKVAMAYGDLSYSYGAFCAKITIEQAYEGLISTYLKGYWFRSHLEQMLLGTTINNIKREDIEGIELSVSNISILKEFEEAYQSFASYKASIVRELDVLCELQKKTILSLSKGA